MSGGELEEYLWEVVRREGYKVRLRKWSGDLGADLVLTCTGGKVMVVEGKRYKKNVGI
ncbi:restriction endonuclease, partial [Siminovitchia fortis]|uniref:restriction endonuclease n=1 Tax=Siminovitchia fortis TaxID=254758 RepID=UPI0036F424A8